MQVVLGESGAVLWGCANTTGFGASPPTLLSWDSGESLMFTLADLTVKPPMARITAFDTSTCVVIWETSVFAAAPNSSLLLSDDGQYLVVSTWNGTAAWLHVVNTTDGAVVAQTQVTSAGNLTTPALHSRVGLVLVGDSNGTLHAFRFPSVALAWSLRLPASDPLVTVSIDVNGSTAFVLAQNMVTPDVIYGVSIPRRKVAWNFTVSGMWCVSQTPSDDDGQWLCGHALRGFVVDDAHGTLIAMTPHGTTMCLNMSTGGVIYVAPTTGNPDTFVAPPVATMTAYYYSSANIGINGVALGSCHVDCDVFYGPFAVGGHARLAVGDGFLVAQVRDGPLLAVSNSTTLAHAAPAL